MMNSSLDRGKSTRTVLALVKNGVTVVVISVNKKDMESFIHVLANREEDEGEYQRCLTYLMRNEAVERKKKCVWKS